MKKYGPLLTLLAVALLGGGLFAAAAVKNPSAQPTAAAAPPAAAPAEAAPPAAPAEPAAAPPVVAEKAYTGRSSGDEVTVAIAVKDGRAVGYVCDGKKIEAWLEGTLAGDRLDLESADGKITVTGVVDEEKSVGDVTVNGKKWAYATDAVEVPAGLYEGRGNVDGVVTRIGWVVEKDGRVTGLRVNQGSDEPLEAPRLDPSAPDQVQIDGTPITVTVISGGDQVIQQ
jgi:hypothetical protein